MKRQWIRLWVKVRTDPKVQSLPPPVFKFWINLLCMAGERDSRVVNSPERCALDVRAEKIQIVRWLDLLVKKGLLDEENGQRLIHDWDEYQCVSDISTERVRQFRERSRNVSETLRNMQSRAAAEQIRTEAEQSNAPAALLPPSAALPLTQIIPFAAAAAAAAPSPVRAQAEKALLLRQNDIRAARNPEGLALIILRDFGIYPAPQEKRPPSAEDEYNQLAQEIARRKTLR